MGLIFKIEVRSLPHQSTVCNGATDGSDGCAFGVEIGDTTTGGVVGGAMGVKEAGTTAVQYLGGDAGGGMGGATDGVVGGVIGGDVICKVSGVGCKVDGAISVESGTTSGALWVVFLLVQWVALSM